MPSTGTFTVFSPDANGVRDNERELTEQSREYRRSGRPQRNYARKSSKRIAGEVDLKAVAEKTMELLNKSAQQARFDFFRDFTDQQWTLPSVS